MGLRSRQTISFGNQGIGMGDRHIPLNRAAHGPCGDGPVFAPLRNCLIGQGANVTAKNSVSAARRVRRVNHLARQPVMSRASSTMPRGTSGAWAANHRGARESKLMIATGPA
jgi:hypothetical protein